MTSPFSCYLVVKDVQSYVIAKKTTKKKKNQGGGTQIHELLNNNSCIYAVQVTLERN